MKKSVFISMMVMVMAAIMVSCKPICTEPEPEPVKYITSFSELVNKEVIIIHGENHEQHQLVFNDVVYDIIAYHITDAEFNDRLILEDVITVADNTINGTKNSIIITDLINGLFVSQ